MNPGQVTSLLEQLNTGDQRAFESLLTAVYGELRMMAASLMRDQRNGHILQPTALVNEAYLRLVQGENRWDGRAHFFGAAASAMRQVLVAHARQKSAQKRAGAAKRITFSELAVSCDEPQADVLALDQAMTALGRVDERFVRVMELRYFAGCSLSEIAELTGRSLASVKRDWTYSRAWLYNYMNA
jgi:RNA polymerase sigma-70 factor, ECF subfamily